MIFNKYTIKDAVKCGEWIHYKDKKTGNLAWERTSVKTWKGNVLRVWRSIDFWTLAWRKIIFKWSKYELV